MVSRAIYICFSNFFVMLFAHKLVLFAKKCSQTFVRVSFILFVFTQVFTEIFFSDYVCNLIALIKIDGGLRPIAIGNTLRRIASKCAGSKALSERLFHNFS